MTTTIAPPRVVPVLTDIEQVALTKLGLKNLPEVEPGTYSVDMIVHIKGAVKVGAPTQAKPTASLPTKAVIAMLLRRMGVQREAAKEVLLDILTRIYEGEKVEDDILQMTGVEEAFKALDEVLSRAPKIERAGRTTTTLVVEKL